MLVIKITVPASPPAWEPLGGRLWDDCRYFRQATNFAVSKGYKVDWAGALARGLLCMAMAGATLVELHETAQRAHEREQARLGYRRWPDDTPGSGRFA